MSSRNYCSIFVAATLGVLLPFKLLACPLIGGLVDYNCDQKHKIVFTGDSVVAGIGDTPANRGGYVTRIANKHPLSEVINLGYPGISSDALFRRLQKNFRRGSSNATVKKFAGADLVVIDAGRNDYWSWDGTPPVTTIRNLKRIVALIREQLAKSYGEAPPVGVATLLYTTRSYQRYFIRSVIDLMLQFNSHDLPVYLRPDTLGYGVLSYDGIHPNKTGYDKIANKIINKFITVKAQDISRAARPDRDHDGVYDLFETIKYDTLPSEFDSDGDGYSDGEELFTYGTDPLDILSKPVV